MCTYFLFSIKILFRNYFRTNIWCIHWWYIRYIFFYTTFFLCSGTQKKGIKKQVLSKCMNKIDSTWYRTLPCTCATDSLFEFSLIGICSWFFRINWYFVIKLHILWSPSERFQNSSQMYKYIDEFIKGLAMIQHKISSNLLTKGFYLNAETWLFVTKYTLIMQNLFANSL